MSFMRSISFIKKINLRFLAAFFAFIISIALICEPVKNAMAEITNSKQAKQLIIIDPGHGGFDPGAIAVNNVNEKDINLQISLILRDLLKLNGYDVILTRDSDISLDDTDNKAKRGVLERKRIDINNRLCLMNEHEDSVVLSIHQNEYTKEKYSGAQMFFGKINPQSRVIAKNIQEQFVALLQPENNRVIKPAPKSVYLPNHAKNPIVLVECGFISNYQEAELLSDEKYQQKVAFAIFSGI